MTRHAPKAEAVPDQQGAASTTRSLTPAVAVLLLASSLTVMAGAVVTPVIAALRQDLQLSSTQAGLVLTIHALSLAVTAPYMGALLDRHGPRPVLTLGLLVYGVAGGAGSLTESLVATLTLRLVFGVGVAAVFASTTVGLLTVVGVSQGRLMGLRGSAMSAGGVVWPLVGGLAAMTTWRGAFMVYLIGVPIACWAWVALPTRCRTVHESRLATAPTSLLRVLRCDPRILGVCAYFALGTAVMYTIFLFVPVRLAELEVPGMLRTALLISLMSLSASISGLGYPRLSGRLQPRRLLCMAYAVVAASVAVIAWSGGLALIAVGMVGFGAAIGVTVPALTQLIAGLAPEGALGRITALSGTAIFLGQFLSPLVIGPVADTTSTVVALLVTAAVAAAASLILLPAAPRWSRRRRTSASRRPE